MTCSTPAPQPAPKHPSTPGYASKEAPLTDNDTTEGDVTFIRGNDRMRQLAQRHDMADEVAQIRARMADALTQVALARRMGVTQAAISRIEQPHDLLLSTLNAYLAAIGGTAHMIVSFAVGHETTLGLATLT